MRVIASTYTRQLRSGLPQCRVHARRLQPFRHLHDCSGCFRLERWPDGTRTHWKSAALYQRSLIMTHRDRAGDASGQWAGSREAAGDAGHRQGFPTPATHSRGAGSPARPERRFPKGFRPGGGRPIALRRGRWLPMPRIAAPRAPGRKPWEAVSMGHYQRSLV